MNLRERLKMFQEKLAIIEFVNIWTPLGPYETSLEKSEGLDKFFKETELENQGACGGQYSYNLTQTSLGTIFIVVDTVSKKEYDATCYEAFYSG